MVFIFNFLDDKNDYASLYKCFNDDPRLFTDLFELL